MLRRILNTAATATLMWFAVAGTAVAQNLQQDYDQDYNNDPNYLDNVRIDRYLDVEVWTNHLDGDFFVGDNVVINYRASRDAFVAIYSIDTKGRVNLLFPTDPGRDNFVPGGVTNYLPGPDDDFDLVVSGPDGVENIQIIASRERFPIPEWFPVSGLICDWDDRHEFMDNLNGEYFVRYDGQKFAFDRTAMYINEWEPVYFRPIYYPYYPSWTVCGNAYIDYPWGASIYIDGVYWGCAPLYIPRIYVGWHTITIYNHWGHCWEQDVHFSHYHTVILNRDIIRPQPLVVSKYKEVRSIGYRDPVKSGYPKFKEHQPVVTKAPGVKEKATNVTNGAADYQPTGDKRYVRGNAKLVATARGYETAGAVGGKERRTTGVPTRTSDGPLKSTGSIDQSKRQTTGDSFNGGSDHGSVVSGGKKVDSKPAEKQSKGFYQKKSGSQTPTSKPSQPAVQPKRDKGGSESKPTIRPNPPSGGGGSEKKTGAVKPPPSKPSSGSGAKSTTTKTKTGGGASKQGDGR